MIEKSEWEWVPGTVFASGVRRRIQAGQLWGYYQDTTEEGSSVVTYDAVMLQVISTSPEGEVQLRPADEASRKLADEMWPERGFVKGGPAQVNPFKRVDKRTAQFDVHYQEGDFLAHEAWACWLRLDLVKA